jgi:hypothetical protein
MAMPSRGELPIRMRVADTRDRSVREICNELFAPDADLNKDLVAVAVFSLVGLAVAFGLAISSPTLRDVLSALSGGG